MRVGIDATAMGGGRGPARYTNEIVKVLTQCCGKDDQFYLYSPYDIGFDQLPGNFVKCKVPRQGNLPWLNWTLPQRAKKDKIDVMFFPANDYWFWPYKRTVVSVLDVAPATLLRGYHRSLSDRLQNKMQMWALGQVADQVITISEYSSQQIQNVTGISFEKIKVIYCGVQKSFKPTDKPKKDFILYVGGFDRRKNLERLIDAYSLLLDQGCKEKLVLAGHSKTGGYAKLYYDVRGLLRTKKMEGKVEVVENPSDDKITELYQTAKLFVFPSLIEGFGLPVLEAMACGCPVVCSNAASLPEVGGDAVLYFDPCDIRGMADTMQRVLGNASIRSVMIEKGLARAKGFSWEQAGQKIYQILNNIGGRNGV